MKAVRCFLVCLLVLAAAFPSFSSASGEAPDITDQCVFRFSSGNQKKALNFLTDGKYTTSWTKTDKAAGWITVQSGETPVAGLYFCFLTVPSSWMVQVPADDDWETVFTGDSSFLHVWVPLEKPSGTVRFVSPEENYRVQIAELRVYGFRHQVSVAFRQPGRVGICDT